MKELTSYEGVHCANCQTPMAGAYCHHCGQSIHSVLKPVHGMAEEFLETILHIDGRIVHTLPPLLFKPGFLTLEYFSGRRVRYIKPFRLMFILCVLSFFTLHLATDMVAKRLDHREQKLLVETGSNDFAQATTPQEVQHRLDNDLNALDAVRVTGNAAVIAQTHAAEQRFRDQANQRLAELGAAPVAAAASSTAAHDADDASTSPQSVIPLQIHWLPDIVNQRVTALGQHIYDNWHTFKHGDAAAREATKQRMITGFFGALPGTMFVMIPVFAMLLAVFYAFRRRLYMEHLIVALHSHAFIFLSLLLIVVLGMLSAWLKPHAAWAGHTVGAIESLLVLWVPVYLLLMQKRVYRQGWPMTLVKYWFVGWCYLWLLLFALLIAGMLGLAH